jgi:hypothetical protein
MAAVTWYAIIRLANGNQQRVTVPADNQINARLMIEPQVRERKHHLWAEPPRPHEGHLTAPIQQRRASR